MSANTLCVVFLHFNNSEDPISSDQPGYDPLFKVHSLLDIATYNFEKE